MTRKIGDLEIFIKHDLSPCERWMLPGIDLRGLIRETDVDMDAFVATRIVSFHDKLYNSEIRVMEYTMIAHKIVWKLKGGKSDVEYVLKKDYGRD